MATQGINMVFTGLGSFSGSVPVAGTYQVIGRLDLPTVSKGNIANSQVVTTVSQNGTLMYTGLAGAEGFDLTLVCAAGDVIQVTTSSSAAVDQGANAFRVNVSIG